MSGINGTWELVSTENFLDFMKACGSTGDALERAKKLEVTGPAGGKEEFNFDGTNVTRKILNPEGKVVSEVSTAVGAETASKTADGRDIKTKLTVSGDTVTREETGDGYSSTWTRTVNGDEMTLVMTTGSTTCTRKYKRV